MTIDEIRLANARELAASVGTRAAFGSRLGMDNSQVSQLIGKNPKKNIGDSIARRIEEVFDKPRGWMDTAHAYHEQSNLLPVTNIKGDVPVISWVTAGHWADVADPFEPGVADDWRSCPNKHGPHTFALRVRGVSMENHGGKVSYSDGDIIFVDPERQYENGSRVIVRLEADKEATFKELVIEGERKYLKALNPSWPDKIIEINGNAVICGVVIGKWTDE